MEPEEVTLRDRLRARLWRRMADDGPVSDRMIDGVMRDVDVYAALCAREGFARGWRARVPGIMALSSPETEYYPLPKRTRQVLREEPIPGYSSPFYRLYRVSDGELQRTTGADNKWEPAVINSADFELMAHAINLRANPYRTEEVEADESNPWGDE